MINGSADKKLSFVFLLLLTAAALYLGFLIARPIIVSVATALVGMLAGQRAEWKQADVDL